jgi:hypothetical protein
MGRWTERTSTHGASAALDEERVVSFLSLSKQLPQPVIGGVLRLDILRSRAEEHQMVVFVPGEPVATGQLLVVEVHVDPSRCTWEDPDHTTNWCLLTGEVSRDTGDATLVIGTGMEVTTDCIPKELVGSFKILLQENAGAWELIRLSREAPVR